MISLFKYILFVQWLNNYKNFYAKIKSYDDMKFAISTIKNIS